MYNIYRWYNMKVSIIVPVYNVEKYLDKCLTSLVNQTLKDIEIIIINDGSTDNSQTIIDRFKKENTNIKSFEQNLLIVMIILNLI